MSKVIKINNNKFKSIYFSYNFTLKLEKEEIAKTVISCFAASKGSKKYETTKEIEKYLASLYGSNFEVNVEKIGDIFNFEFKIECVNKIYLPNEEDVFIKCIEFLKEMIYNPKVKDNKFSNDIFEREKSYVISLIEKRKDEKIRYAVSRAEELMCRETAFGSFVYGDIDTASNVTNDSAYSAYQKLLKSSAITVIVSGNLDGYDDLEKSINEIFDTKLDNGISLSEMKEFVNMPNKYESSILEEKEVVDTVQSVICFGIKNEKEKDEDFYVANVYNTILGGSPASKLFQNVREKESLAYTARSRYYRFKKMYVIYAGIEEKNYEKAKEVIIKQIDDMKSGNITEIELNAAKESIISDIKEWKDSKIALAKQSYISNISGIAYSIEEMIEKIRNVTIDDIAHYANNIEIKVIYLLGGEK